MNLGYITGTLLAPNFAGYLISKGLTNRERKTLIQEIAGKISTFNRKFDDTEVDSNFFAQFLEQIDIVSSIIDRVFHAYKTTKDDFNSLSKDLAKEAIDFVNLKKDKNNHPHVKGAGVFENYFSELFEVLVDFRESLLDIKDQAMVSIISESVSQSEDNIIKTLEDKLGDNYLLEQRIDDISTLIDKGLYDEAHASITEISDTMVSINKEQRAKLLYQKARMYIDTDQIDRGITVQKSIRHICPECIYIDEINYSIGCKKHDGDLVEKAIQGLREKGVTKSNLMLKESYFQLLLGNFDKVKKFLMDNETSVKSEFKDEISAISQLGLVALFSDYFEDAESYFNRALKIKYNIHDDYQMIIAKAFIFKNNIRGIVYFNEDLKEKARQIYSDLERTEYFIKDRSKELRVQHWEHYLTFLGVDNPELAIKKFKDIDKDLVDEDRIRIVMYENFFYAEEYNDAAKYLKDLWKRETVFLKHILFCYEMLNDWEKVGKIFEEDIEHLYDFQGVILYYKIQLFEKMGKIEDAKKLIIERGKQYKKSSWFLEETLRFLYKYSMMDEYEIVMSYVLDLPEQIELSDKITLSKMLNTHGKFEVVRNLLEKSILLDDEALMLYLYSYGEVSPKNEMFENLKKVVTTVYSQGNRAKFLLQIKFYIELLTERYLDAMELLSEYRTIHCEDSFYQVNLIQCCTSGALNYDASKEAKELLGTDELKNHIIVAQYFAYKGRWDDAKSVLRNAYYIYDEQIGEEESFRFINTYFNNFHQDNCKAEYAQVCDDSVVILEDSECKIINVSIHSNDRIVHENGEIKFNCVNLMSTSDESLVLKAIGKKGSRIEFNGQNYKVLEVLDIDTYFFRYFLKKMEDEYPGNKAVIPISGESIEEMREKIMVYMRTGNEAKKRKLKLYNFGVETGVPITYLSGKDVDKYLETLYFLMNNEEQEFYSVYSNIVPKGSRYVLTISSLVILNVLGYLDKVKSISDRLYVTPSIKTFVRKGISDSIKYDAVVSTAFLDEYNNFRLEESSEDTKVFKKTFWTRVLTAIIGFNEIRPKVIDTSIYDKLHEFVDISEFEAITIAREESVVLVCDDLFIANVSIGVNNTVPVVNWISLLYEEEIIDINELIKLVIDLTKKKYLNCINHKILFNIYVHLVKSQGTQEFDDLYVKVSQIFEQLFGEQSRDFNGHLYKSFFDLVLRNNMMSSILNGLLHKPLGF